MREIGSHRSEVLANRASQCWQLFEDILTWQHAHVVDKFNFVHLLLHPVFGEDFEAGPSFGKILGICLRASRGAAQRGRRM